MGYKVPLEQLKPNRRFRIPGSFYKDDIYTLLQITEEPFLPVMHSDGENWAHGTRLHLGRYTLVEPCEDK